MKLFVLTLCLVASVAFAHGRQVSLPVGHTATLSMPSPVSKVSVTNPDLVDITTDGRKVTLVGRTKGSTEAVIRTADGEHRFKIYVAEDKYSMPYQ